MTAARLFLVSLLLAIPGRYAYESAPGVVIIAETPSDLATPRIHSHRRIGNAPDWAIPALVRAERSSGVPAALLAAVVEVESGWRLRAVGQNSNGTRDFGAFQHNETCLSYFGKRYLGRDYDPNDFADAAMVTAEHLAAFIRDGRSLSDALVAYNFGEGNVARRKIAGRPLPRRVIEYAERVLELAGFPGMGDALWK